MTISESSDEEESDEEEDADRGEDIRDSGTKESEVPRPSGKSYAVLQRLFSFNCD